MLALWWCHSATGTEGTQLSGGKCTHALQKNVTKCRFFSLVRDAVASLHRDEKKKRHLMLHGFMHGVKISCADSGSVGILTGTKRGKMPKVPFIVIIVWVCLYNHKAFLLISTWGLPLVFTYMKTYFLVTILYVLFHPLSSACAQYHFSSGSFGCTCPANSCKLIIGIFIAFTNNRLWLSSSHPATLSQHTRTYTLSVRPAWDSINFLRWANEQTGAS